MKRPDLAHMLLPALLLAGLVGGCAKSVDNGSAANNAAQAPVTEAIEEPDSVDAGAEPSGPPTDTWVGRWTGPEGLFLDIQPSPNGKRGHYAIANKDSLDRQANYEGVGEGDRLRFTRDGQALVIRAGTGAETGFKYLADKQDCLIVQPGKEGYCR